VTRNLHNDPTVPAYLPPWPQRWPDSAQQAHRVVDDMRPRSAAIRAGRVLAAAAAIAIGVALLFTMHPLISIPLIVGSAAAMCGIAEKRRRRRDRAEKRRQQPYQTPRSER